MVNYEELFTSDSFQIIIRGTSYQESGFFYPNPDFSSYTLFFQDSYENVLDFIRMINGTSLFANNKRNRR